MEGRLLATTQTRHGPSYQLMITLQGHRTGWKISRALKESLRLGSWNKGWVAKVPRFRSLPGPAGEGQHEMSRTLDHSPKSRSPHLAEHQQPDQLILATLSLQLFSLVVLDPYLSQPITPTSKSC